MYWILTQSAKEIVFSLVRFPPFKWTLVKKAEKWEKKSYQYLDKARMKMMLIVIA